jgi:2-oxoisovalerate dehydrogenase E2 component (dihydrolipoyl transacylase)
MSAANVFKLPDLGEGLTEAEVVTWLVAAGDTVVVNQIIVEVETAKALVELPAPFAGMVSDILVAAGVTVSVGTALISITPEGAESTPVSDAAPTVASDPAGLTAIPDAQPDDDAPANLVGYGPKAKVVKRVRRAVAVATRVVESASVAGDRPAAKPPVRRLAKDMGVDLGLVAPTGRNGTITRDDVIAAAEPTHPAVTERGGDMVVAHRAPSGGEDVRIPIKGVRKHMAAAMVASAFTAPHVTEFLTIDVSPTLQLIERIRTRREFADTKLTPLAIIARAVVGAAQRFPDINASWDEAAQEIVIKGSINLGIAAATPRGLLVPNIKGIESMSLLATARAINLLAITAREGRTSQSDLTGGTITITNVGVFGVDTGTPILNPGESAILAVGAINRRPWVVGEGADERIEIRSVMQLALSFDHRIVDGENGSKALAYIGAILAEPGLALL